MELAENGSLYNYVKKKINLKKEEIKEFMTQIIKAVAYLHQKEPAILHRDLKPENILLKGNEVKLCDFGWSNLDDKQNIRNTFCGTPEYLSPEMILGTGHDEKVDVWSLGVLMYEMFTGHSPFSASEEIKD